MAYENILLEEVETGIYKLTINRPRSFNALNGATLDEISLALDEIAGNDQARVLLVTGAGEKAFIAGADISEMKSKSALEARTFADKGQKTLRKFEILAIPVIAVVNGFALGGGCELAMSCDWIIASERAQFGQPEVNLGVTPGFGGSQRLPRLIGRAKAMELVITGRQIKAAEAKEWGLVNHVYGAEELMDKAIETARLIMSKGPAAVRLTKESVQRGQDMDLDNACILEKELFALCFATEDQKEGMGAFLEKRKAEFKNC